MTPTMMVCTASRLACPGQLAAPATAAATSELVNIDEVNADVLCSGERTNHGAQRSCGTARATDDLAYIVGVHAHLEHPPPAKFLVLDGDIVGMGDDAPDQMFECVGKHLGLAGPRIGNTGIGNTGIGSLLSLPWSALHGGFLSLMGLGL